MGESCRRRRDLLVVGGVAGLHVLVLAPLALREAPSQETAAPIVFDIVLERSPRPARSVEAASSDRPSPETAWVEPKDVPRRAGPSDPTPLSPLFTDAGQAADTAGQTAPPGAAIARAMRLNGDCQRLGDPAERELCQARRADRALRSGRTIRSIEDAAFAAEGQRALADYDRRRAPLRPNSRAVPCAHDGDIMGRCDFRVETRVWSSRDGVLPDVPRLD